MRSAAAIGAGGAMSKFGDMNALARRAAPATRRWSASSSAGGNDGHNTVVPIATAQQNYSVYAQARGGLTIPQSSPAADPQRQRHLRPASQPAGDPGSLPAEQGGYSRQRRDAGGAIRQQSRVPVGPDQHGALRSSSRIRTRPASGRLRFPPGSAARAGADASRTFCRRSRLRRTRARFSRQFPPISGCGPFCTGVNNLPATVPPSGSASQATTMATLGGLVPGSNTASGHAAAAARSTTDCFWCRAAITP